MITHFVKGVLYIGYYKAWFVATKQESPIEVLENIITALTIADSFSVEEN